MNRWLLLLLCVLWVQGTGCGVASQAKGCEYDEDCGPNLVCKGAVCGPLKSTSGGKCVTDKGCATGLRCMDGTCSAGLADSDACSRACQHVASLMLKRAQDNAPPPQAGQPNPQAALGLQAMTFEAECHQACVDQMSRARTDCMASLKDLDGLELCP